MSSPLTVPDLQALLDVVTYKPGWRFELYDGRMEGPHVAIWTQVLDAYDPETTTVLDVHSMLPPMRSAEQFYDWLLWRICRIETHEAREFLRVAGAVYDDPHADGADQDRRA